MIHVLMQMYRTLFARKIFYKFNKLLFRFSLSGLGILNYRNAKESGEAAFLKAYLARDRFSGVVLDIGANRGDYTLMCLNLNPTIKVISFEPHPKTFLQLSHNLKDKEVRLVNKAMGGKSGTLQLYDYADEDGSSHASIYKDVIENIHGKKSVSHSVEVSTVDHFLEQENIGKVGLLKIDAEGNELEVLKGSILAIQNKVIEAIHFEFNEMNVASRCFFKDFMSILEGYEFYRLLPNGMIRINKYTPLYCEIFAYQNIVAFLRR
jgi:FkbM family methyltransferase